MAQQQLARPFGPKTNQLVNIFNDFSEGKSVLNVCKIRPAVNQLNLFPSRSQIFELVTGACEISGRTPVDHVSFGEFCLLVTELQHRYRLGVSKPVPLSRYRKSRGGIRHVHRQGPSIFLGGSCNPTTWRQEITIPQLKEKGLSFFNPQVSEWSPELIEIEDQAKQDSEVLFFVIDHQTRATSAMVEAAYLAGCGRQLILVVSSLECKTKEPVQFCTETATPREIEDLKQCHIYLTYLVERQSIPVFSDVAIATKCAIQVILEGTKVSDLTLEDGAEPVKYGHLRIADKLLRLKEAFNSIDTSKSGILNLKDVSLAFKAATNEQLSTFVIDDLRASRRNSFSFEDFLILVAEYRYVKGSLWERIINAIAHLPLRIMDAFGSRANRTLPSIHEPCVRDIFLGGTCGDSTWRQDVAIPALRKYGISYYHPVVLNWNRRYIGMEASLKDSCRLLLYVIAASTRGMASMVEAASYIGQGCRMVLCLQHLKPGATIDGEELTCRAIKDYNRARAYLADIANREGVPIFDRVEEAVQRAIEIIRETC